MNLDNVTLGFHPKTKEIFICRQTPKGKVLKHRSLTKVEQKMLNHVTLSCSSVKLNKPHFMNMFKAQLKHRGTTLPDERIESMIIEINSMIESVPLMDYKTLVSFLTGGFCSGVLFALDGYIGKKEDLKLNYKKGKLDKVNDISIKDPLGKDKLSLVDENKKPKHP